MQRHLKTDASRPAPSSHCLACIVRDRAVCAALSDSDVTDLGRKGRKLHLNRGQPLMWEGEDSFLVANVIDGVFKLSTTTSDGREQIVGVAYPSDFIGRPFGEQSNHEVTALTDASVCIFPRDIFDSYARDHPELQRRLLGHALNELDRARRWILLLGRMTAAERVASFLLELSDRLSDSVSDSQCAAGSQPLDRFNLPLGRQQIADVLGLTIETVSRQLSSLRAAGLIDIVERRHIHILDRERLSLVAGA